MGAVRCQFLPGGPAEAEFDDCHSGCRRSIRLQADRDQRKMRKDFGSSTRFKPRVTAPARHAAWSASSVSCTVGSGHRPAAHWHPIRFPASRLTHICDRRARDKRARQPESLRETGSSGPTRSMTCSPATSRSSSKRLAEPGRPSTMSARSWRGSRWSPRTQDDHRAPRSRAAVARGAQGRQLRYEAAVGGAMPISWRARRRTRRRERVTASNDLERHQQRRALPDGRQSGARLTGTSPMRALAASPSADPSAGSRWRGRSGEADDPECSLGFRLPRQPLADRDAGRRRAFSPKTSEMQERGAGPFGRLPTPTTTASGRR